MAHRHHLQAVLPKKKLRTETTDLIRHVAVIRCGDQFLVQKRGEGLLMADLYEYPYIDIEPQKKIDPQHEFEQKLNLKLIYNRSLNVQRHSFTRYRAVLLPHLFDAEECRDEHLWKSSEELAELPFSAGHKRILADCK